MLITAPASVMDTADRGNKFASMFDFKIFIAAWISTGIFLLIIMFGIVTANFNPIVTLFEIGDGHDSVRLGCGKILAQFAGAIAASYTV
jgi:glycerol uptake facilitator-like aquaporin